MPNGRVVFCSGLHPDSKTPGETSSECRIGRRGLLANSQPAFSPAKQMKVEQQEIARLKRASSSR
jgi:hypothetical protein